MRRGAPGRALTPALQRLDRSRELGGADDRLERGGDLPAGIHDEDPRLTDEPVVDRRLDRLELAVRIEDWLEAAVRILELVRFDVDEREAGLLSGALLEDLQGRDVQAALEWATVPPCAGRSAATDRFEEVR